MILRVATIGRNGQTARALAAVAALDAEVVLSQAGSKEADLRDPASLTRFVDDIRPHVVINTGAYNFVDKAESEPDEAMLINADGPRALARHCNRIGIPFVHMSTDCVFDGYKAGPYTEDDKPNPLSAYGRSKLAGENAVAEEYPAALTARVCWVFSEYGETFVSRMLSLAHTRPKLQVVSDQVGPPTYAPDIATALVKAAREMTAGTPDLSGILHVAAPGYMNRADMAKAILQESARLGGPTAAVEPVLTETFKAPAKRPLNACLSGVRATTRLNLTWTPWQEALQRSVAGVLNRA